MNICKQAVIAAGMLGFVLTGAANAVDGWGADALGVQDTANSSGSQEQALAITPNAFGLTVYNKLQIHASAFTTRCGDTNYRYGGNGYIYATDIPCDNLYAFWAPIQLPSGALIKWFDFYYYDTDADNDLRAIMHAYTGSDPAYDNPSYSQLGLVSSSGNSGYGYEFLAMNHTVNNDVRYNGGAQLAAIVAYPGTDATILTNKLRFKAVDIWWQRQISPAPATATFSDVPTDYWAFEGIEALAASGITTGCGGSNFCPDDNVTRAQMAIFLARALGLHWPN